MLGITPFGLLHTLISLVSLFAGIYALWRYGEISWRTVVGKTYVLVTIATCVTGLFIFRHGGFNEAHALSILTLVVLAFAWLAERGAQPRNWRRHLAVHGYTFTVFFHFIPAYNETLMRIPVGNPLISGPTDPLLSRLIIGTLVFFILVMIRQWQRIRGEPALGHGS